MFQEKQDLLNVAFILILNVFLICASYPDMPKLIMSPECEKTLLTDSTYERLVKHTLVHLG